jgi:hypothetical protein
MSGQFIAEAEGTRQRAAPWGTTYPMRLLLDLLDIVNVQTPRTGPGRRGMGGPVCGPGRRSGGKGNRSTMYV